MSVPQPPDTTVRNATSTSTSGDLTPRDWRLYVVPLVAFVLFTQFEPKPPQAVPAVDQTHATPASDTTPADAQNPAAARAQASEGLIPYRWYPVVYTAKLVAVVGLMLWLAPGYRAFAFRVHPVALAVGGVGIVVWVGLAMLERDVLKTAGPSAWLSSIAGGETRSAYNPFVELADRPALAWAFWVVRMCGLALVVPVIEEFFLRGFLMRYFARPDWWQVPIGTWERTGVAVVTVVAVLMHPGEVLAALAWFSLVTALLLWGKNLWDCVAAHAVTNLLLGLYVLVTGTWWLM